jgi:hypothetical protein
LAQKKKPSPYTCFLFSFFFQLFTTPSAAIATTSHTLDFPTPPKTPPTALLLQLGEPSSSLSS